MHFSTEHMLRVGLITYAGCFLHSIRLPHASQCRNSSPSSNEICQKPAYKVYNAKELEGYIDVNFPSIALNLMLKIKRFRCYKGNIEKGKRDSSCWESNPEYLDWVASGLWQPASTILCIHCTGGTECFSRTLRSNSACAVRTSWGVYWKMKMLIMSGCQVWGLVVVYYHNSVAEHWQLKPGALGSIPSGCRPSSTFIS